MSHFNFGNFLVDESNHDAFQVCQDVADLIPVAPLPVLIVGDEGCGKSHLLYSIVNRLRAGTAKTGLALVTANAFPDQVLSLISDPTPVAKAKSAVLLIDQLEQFRDHLEELEGVVRIFLDHDHYVIGASSIHPGRLRELPDELRRTFESGTVATIKPSQSTPQIDRVRQQIRSEHQDELDRAAKEIEELRMLLREATGNETTESTPADRVSAAEMKVLTDQLRNALAEAEEARETADTALSAAIAERDALMLRETEVLAEAEAKHQTELSPLRERLSESEIRLSELDVRAEVLTSEADEAKAALETHQREKDDLHGQIDQLKSDLEDAAKPDEALLSEMETLRTLFAASEEARETERDKLDTEHADSFATLQDELSQVRTDHTRLEEDMEALRASKEDEAGRMRTEIERLQSERTQMDDEVNRQADDHARDTQSLHDKLTAQHEELEQTREQAGAVEALQSQADEAEVLRAELASRDEEVESLRTQAAEADALRARAEGADALQSELDTLRERQTEETAQLAEERESLAQELGEVRLDHDRLLQRLTDIESSATTATQERDEAIAARDEAQAAREEAMQRAEHVLDQVEANRVRMAESAEHQQARIIDLEQRLSSVNTEENGTQETIADLEQRLMQSEHTAEERGQALEALTGQTQELESALEEARTRRDVDVDVARKESSDAIEQLDRIQRQFDETQSAFDLAQHRVRSLEGDLTALQAEAAAQVARANTQAGETESRLARILSAFETASAENHALRDELGEPNGSAENSANRLMLLAERLATGDPGRVARAINPDSFDDSDHSI
jgi:chromosome segregation ATPase